MGAMKRIVKRMVGLVLAATLAVTPAAAADPPYEALLQRLAEVLGSLHYLDGLCDPGTTPWRAQMEALIEAEQPDGQRRARLNDRFNIGYSSFAATYRTCTPAARLALERYHREGADLAADISARFGPPVPAAAAPPP
jgi:uncharacterized protein (TIGR02301 family)